MSEIRTARKVMRVIKAIIYHNPRCSKSRSALEYLKKHNIDADIRLYMNTGITRAEIFDILELLKCDVKNLIRTDDETIRDKYYSTVLLSRDGLINSIITHPILLERPIILFKENGIGAICRSEDSLQSLFKYVGIDVKSDTN